MTEQTPAKPATNPAAIGCLAVVILIAGVCGYSRIYPNKGAETVDLKASVQFSGTQFTVKNVSTDQTWTDVECTLNDDFEFRVSRLGPGEQFTVGAMQFAKSDGTRFNPLQMKALKMMVAAKLNGRLAFYQGRWN